MSEGEKSTPPDQHKTLKSILPSKPDGNGDMEATGTDDVVASPSDQHSSEGDSKLQQKVSGRNSDSESNNSRQPSLEDLELEPHSVSERGSGPESDNSRKTSPEDLDAPLMCLKAEKGEDILERNLMKMKEFARRYYAERERNIQTTEEAKGKDFTERKSGMSKERLGESSRVRERSGRTCPKRSAEHLWERSEDAEDQDFTERVSKEEPDSTRSDRRREGDRSRPTSRKEIDESLPKSSKAQKARSSAAFGRKLRDVVQTPNEITAQMLTEIVCIMYGRSEFAEAIKLLDYYNVGETNIFMANLLLVECCVRSGRSHRARQHMERVGKILIASQIGPETVLNWRKNSLEKSRYTRAVVLKRIASDMFRLSPSSPRKLMIGIYSCLDEISNVTLPMIMEGGDRRSLGLMFGVEFMIDIYNDLKKVTNVNLTEKTLLECSSCQCLALNFLLADKFKESIRYCLDGIRILEMKFGEKASNYAVHSLLLQKAGIGSFTERKFRPAERHYLEAIRTIKAVASFRSDDDRKRALDAAGRGLRQARELLRQESED